MYIVIYYNHNGETTRRNIVSQSERGARAIATRGADGTTTRMVLLSVAGYPMAQRDAVDTFRGCCRGWKPWKNV